MEKMPQRALPELTRVELEETLLAWGEQRYRADQVWRWLYVNLAERWDEMTNLPAPLRARLANTWLLSSVRPLCEQRSGDGGTRKVLLQLADGLAVETVLMSYGGRHTVCLSTQVGCPIRCAFCATGLGGWERNLTSGEIVEQVLFFARALHAQGEAITNLVYMGMGEPFLNGDAVLASIERCNEPQGLNLGVRRITVSTAGVVPGIDRLAESQPGVGLAVSLHAPSDGLRDRLVPINRRYPLAALMAACRHYVERTGRRVSFEYALLDGINDHIAEADTLAGLLGDLLCHINLIPANPVPELPYRPAPRERVLAFARRLRQRGLNVTLRARRGVDIQAGCGQLRGTPTECQNVVQV
jgi:23S rRNA (adenine2503-C2)-methyltransferase